MMRKILAVLLLILALGTSLAHGQVKKGPIDWSALPAGCSFGFVLSGGQIVCASPAGGVPATSLPTLSTAPNGYFYILSDPSGNLYTLPVGSGGASATLAVASLASGVQGGGGLAASGAYSVTAPGGLTYVWNAPCSGSGTVAGYAAASNSWSGTITAPPSTNGSCTATVTGTSGNTLSATSPSTVISPPGSPSLSFTSLGNGTQGGSTIAGVLAYANGTPTGLNYSWNAPCSGSGSASTFSASGGVINATFTPPPSTNGSCTLTATGTGPNTATSTSSAVIISPPATPTITLVNPANGATAAPSSTVAVSGTYANGTPTTITCTWNPGSIAGIVSGASISGGSFTETCGTPSTPATYSLTVTGTGANTGTSTHTGIVIATAGAAFTAGAVTPAAIGAIGAANTFIVTVTAGDTCGLPSSVTVDSTSVTASTPLTIDATHCSFTIVGPAITSGSYAAHAILVHGAGSAGQIASTATSLFMSAAAVSYNMYVTQAPITSVVQGGGGAGFGNIYFGVKSGDTGNGQFLWNQPNNAQPSQPGYVAALTSIYTGFATSPILPPQPLPAATPASGKYLVNFGAPNGTYFDYNNTIYTWAAGTYYIIVLTPDGGVFVAPASVSGT